MSAAEAGQAGPSRAGGAHPYMGISAPAEIEAMLAEVGLDGFEELFEQIPAGHRLTRPLELPPALRAEADLRRHLSELLIAQRLLRGVPQLPGRRLLAAPRAGRLRRDRRRAASSSRRSGVPRPPISGATRPGSSLPAASASWSGCDFVGLPVYSWGCAAGHAIRMASRINGRREVLVPASIDPERLAVIRTYCGSRQSSTGTSRWFSVDYDHSTGRISTSTTWSTSSRPRPLRSTSRRRPSSG